MINTSLILYLLMLHLHTDLHGFYRSNRHTAPPYGENHKTNKPGLFAELCEHVRIYPRI